MAAPELRLFGAPRLLREGATLALGSKKALALLALLALGGASPRERLAAWLWPDAEPAAARRNLRREIFRLRQQGLRLGEAAGVLTLEARCSVDVQNFRAALARGDEALALGLAQRSVLDGLDGVAGEALDDWLREQRARLHRERQRARHGHAQALAQRGQVASALALWQQALDEDPCQEAALEAAMSLLSAQGERAQALALYERSAAALMQELGVAASAPLQQMASALRSGAAPAQTGTIAATASPVQAPSRPPIPPGAPYVSRPALEAAVHAGCERGQRVYLQGEPGIGKTRLACACAGQRGAWLYVACAVDDAGQPFSTALRALRLLRDAAPGHTLPGWVQRELAQLMPEYGAPPHAMATSEARQRLLAAFGEALRAFSEHNFHTVVIDDWQWCDLDSAPLLQGLGLGGSTGGAAPACIVTLRSAQLASPLLQRMRQELDDQRAQALVLEGFDATQTLALLRAPAGHAEAQALAQRLCHSSAGNPFFIVETLNLLLERGWLGLDEQGLWRLEANDQSDGSSWPLLPIPGSVREAVLARVRAQGDAARRLLEAACLLAGEFDAALLEGTTGASGADAVAALEHAQAARLLSSSRDGYRFAHELLRQCLADSLSPARRQWLHGQLAERLAQRHAAPARVAAQYEQAGQAPAAVRWRLAAAEQAWQVHALAEARQQWQHALADSPSPEEAVQAQLALARLHHRLADVAACSQCVAAAVEASARAGVRQRVMARLACAEDWSRNGRSEDSLALIDALAGDLPRAGVAEQARAHTLAAKILRWQGQHDAARQREQQAIALLESAPDGLAQLGAVLDGAARLALSRSDPAAAEALARRAVAAFEASHEPGGLAQAWSLVGLGALFARGDRDTARAVFERGRALAASCGHVPAQRAALLNLIKLHTDRGEATTALALLEEGEALAPGFEHPMAEQAFAQARFYVHYLRGDLARADAAAQHLLALARPLPDRLVLQRSVVMVVDLYLHTGQLAQAGTLLQEAQSAVASGAAPATTELVAKQAWLAWLQGDLPGARQRLAPLAREDHEYHQFESRALVAWIGAAVALAQQDAPAAARWLATIEMDAELPTEIQAMLLAQRLACAQRSGADGGAARVKAEDLLRDGRVPALEAQRLRQALGRS